MYSGHRSQNSSMPSERLTELLEQLKNEYVTMENELNLCKMQRDNYEQKLEAQLSEFQSMKQTIVDLELSYQNMKQSYEDQIYTLKQQLKGVQNNSNGPSGVNVGPIGPLSNQPERRSPSSLNDLQRIHNMSTSVPDTQGQKKRDEMNNFPNFPPNSNPQSQHFPPIMNNYNQPPNVNDKRNIFPPLMKDIPEPPTSQQPVHLPRTMPVSSIISNNPSNIRPPSISASPTTQLENGTTSPNISILNGTNTFEKNIGNGMKNESVFKKEGNDWVVVYNPQVKTNVNINLNHNLDHQSVVCCVRFSHDGKYLATGCNKVAQIYSVDSGERVRAFGSEIDSANGAGIGNAVLPSSSTRPMSSTLVDPTNLGGEKEDSYVRSVCFSPSGQYLVAGAEDRTVKVWDIKTGVQKYSFVGHELDIYSLDFSLDNRFIVSGSGDGKAKIWNMDSGKCDYTLGNEEIGPKEGVTSVAISPDGRYVAAGSLDCVVRLWDTQTGKFIESFKGHDDSVYSVAFSPDGKTLASGSLDKTLKLWDLSGSRSGYRCIATLNGHRDYVLSVAFSPDGKWLISGSKDRSVQFWDPRSTVLHLMLQGHKNSVISVAVSPTQQTFATGSGDFRARIWSSVSSY